MAIQIKAGASLAAACGLIAASPAVAIAPCPGTYSASQAEIAAQLVLNADGTFRYGFSYGALDEEAEGKWHLADERVVLETPNLVAPQFVATDDEPLAENRLRVDLDVPRGISRQYFTAALTLRDGTVVGRQFAEDGLEVEEDPANRAVSLRVHLSVFDIWSADMPLSGATGHLVRLRFVANDLGKVAFSGTVLTEREGALVLEQHDRTLAFRRVGRCQS